MTESDPRIAVDPFHVRVLLDVVKRRGVSPLRVLGEAEAPASLLEDQDGLVEGDVLLKLWQVALRLTGDALLGLHSGIEVNLSSLGILGQIIMTSSTLGEALLARAHFSPLVRHMTNVHVTHRSPWVSFCLEVPRVNDELLRPLVERDFSLVQGFAQFLTYPDAHDVIRPRALHVRHRSPVGGGEYERLFRAPILFGQAENKAVFHEDLLRLPIRFAHPGLRRWFVEHAEKLQQERDPKVGLADRVQLFLHANLPSSLPTEERVARRFGSSLSTFQRRLRREGVCFQELRDRVRRDLALELLRSPGIQVADIIDRLGFGEVRSFYRAFRRWTGQSLRDFHRQDQDASGFPSPGISRDSRRPRTTDGRIPST